MTHPEPAATSSAEPDADANAVTAAAAATASAATDANGAANASGNAATATDANSPADANAAATADARPRAPRAPRDLLARTVAELRGRVAAVSAGRGGPTAVVMTMGALHAGHAALIRRAREEAGEAGTVVVTVFVNPLQFGPGEDLERYPRTLDADLAVAAGAGADVVFAPAVEEVYPGGEPRVRISAGLMGDGFEGVTRPGHFDGMLTVVAKLLHLTRPDLACFGEKDAQQLALIRRMVTDLNFPVRVVGVPTVREPDGLALSSRNRYLGPEERRTALALSRALFAGRDAVAAGAGPAGALAAAHAALEASVRANVNENAGVNVNPNVRPPVGPSADAPTAPAPTAPAATASPGADAPRGPYPGNAAPALHLDYLALIDPTDFTPAGESHTGPAVLAVAARVGSTRLIDNLPLEFGVRS
jgi:pantoate--beta-alanine ligase